MPVERSIALGEARFLTFDCYGTLIDWESGLRNAFRRALPTATPQRLAAVFDRYLEVEAQVESESYRSYREVVAEAGRRVAGSLDLEIPPAAAGALADSVGDWQPFPDTCAALQTLKRRCRLGILSNVDRDLFARTAARLGIEFDAVITAQDVQSYKPAHGHFARFAAAHGRDGWIHVAQSQFHDGVPARQLGIPFVWINRRGERRIGEVSPVAEFPDLRTFAATLAPPASEPRP